MYLAISHAQLPYVLQLLAEVVAKCLDEATNSEYQSTAFPALGTGNLGYPAREVAKCMIEAVIDHVEKNPNSSMKLVKIVIFHKDQEALQVKAVTLQLKLPSSQNLTTH